MSICFDRPWYWWFFAIQIVDWLSSWMHTGFSRISVWRSLIRCFIQMASWVALARAIYSASAVESATHDCFLLLQLTAPPQIWYTYPDVDLRSSTSPAQSASEYPHITFFLHHNNSYKEVGNMYRGYLHNTSGNRKNSQWAMKKKDSYVSWGYKHGVLFWCFQE